MRELMLTNSGAKLIPLKINAIPGEVHLRHVGFIWQHFGLQD